MKMWEDVRQGNWVIQAYESQRNKAIYNEAEDFSNISLPLSNKVDECNTWNGMLHMDDLGSGKIIALSFKVTVIIYEHIFVLSVEK